MPSKKGGGDERMHLRRRPSRWPYGGVEAIHAASSDAACPGLYRKPLVAAIGQLLAPYCPGGHQGNSKQNKDAKCVHFADHFDGQPVLYRAHRPMEEVPGFHKCH